MQAQFLCLWQVQHIGREGEIMPSDGVVKQVREAVAAALLNSLVIVVHPETPLNSAVLVSSEMSPSLMDSASCLHALHALVRWERVLLLCENWLWLQCLQADASGFLGLTSLTCSSMQLPVKASNFNKLFGSLPVLQACCLRLGGRCGASQEQITQYDYRSQQLSQAQAIEFPMRLLQCTQLSSLEVCVEHSPFKPTWQGLPPGISKLQRLQKLRLQNCLTRPLTQQISALTT